MKLIAPMLIVFGSSLYGCDRQGGGGVEPNDLGITQIQIAHEYPQGEPLLKLRGLDSNGVEVATVTLLTGMVLYGADMPEELHAGTELKLTVLDTTTTFVSPDRVPHEINESLSPEAYT